MTNPRWEHYASLAEKNIEILKTPGLGEGHRTRLIAVAQVYATLALAASQAPEEEK